MYMYICAHVYTHIRMLHTFGLPSDLPDAVLSEVRAETQEITGVTRDAYTEREDLLNSTKLRL